MKGLITDIAKAMISWLKEHSPGLNDSETKHEENRIKPMEVDGNWGSCFIRRLHGENLMSIFIQKLENAYFKKNLEEWTAVLILKEWKEHLSEYWNGCRQIKKLLESCPIWPNFKDNDLYENEVPKFYWGTSQKLKGDKDVEKKSGIKRAPLEDYGLFSNAEKSSKHKLEGSLTIPNNSSDTQFGPGKEIKFNAVVSSVVPKVDEEDKLKAKGKT